MKKALIISNKFFLKEGFLAKMVIEGKEEDVIKIITLLKRNYYVREVST